MSVEKALPEKRLSGGDSVERNLGSLQAADAGDIVRLFLGEAGRMARLLPEEEVQLAKDMERGQESSKTLEEGNDEMLNEDRENHVANILTGEKAREHMIMANLRLVFTITKEYIGRGVPFEDILQEGAIGLMKGIEGFNYHLGHRLSTYVGWWIKQAVMRAIADNGRTIRVPEYMGAQIGKMERIERELNQRLGRDPLDEELADALDVDPEKLKEIKRAAKRPVSLEKLKEEKGDLALRDSIANREEELEEEVVTNVLRSDLYNAFEVLSDQEKEVLELKYGLVDGYVRTRKEVAEHQGLTVLEMRGVKRRALTKLKVKRGFKLEDYLK